MFLTMFGGVLVIVGLYYLLRQFAVPNYWRSVLSAALPLAAYSMYAAVTQPAVDIAAMHITVYLSTAVALGLIYSQNRPRGTKLHWAPKIFIGFFIVLFVLLGAFAYIATNGLPQAIAVWVMPGGHEGGVHTAFAGVVPHGEDAAKAVSEHLNQQQKLRDLGWEINMDRLDQIALNASTQADVRIHDRLGAPISDAQVSLVLTRPAQRDADIVVNFVPDGPGVYRGTLRLGSVGQWHAVLKVQRGATDLALEQAVVSVAAP